jgi:hypothetical protein
MSVYDEMYKILIDAKAHEKPVCDHITPKMLESWMDYITNLEHDIKQLKEEQK